MSITREPVRPARPDPRPMRVVYGAGALVAVGALTVGLSRPAPQEVAFIEAPATGSLADVPVVEPQPSASPIAVNHVINYVQLQPGQTPPPGATVIQPNAPTPRVVVSYVSAPAPASKPKAQTAPQPKPQPTTKTKQSGKP